jgi:hypothetical protein
LDLENPKFNNNKKNIEFPLKTPKFNLITPHLQGKKEHRKHNYKAITMTA